ncbi:MAG: flavin reductase family protein [Thermoplasmatota archaeon]
MELPAADLSAAKAYHVLTHIVAPRPIAWVTTLNGEVVNAAPFSWFQAICAEPPLLMIAVADRDGEPKDTARNAIATGELVINIATGDQLETMVATSADLPPDESELDLSNLKTTPSIAVAPPRIDGCAAHLECRLVEHRRYGDTDGTTVLIAHVVHVAMRDDLLTERGLLDAGKARLPARLGGVDYLRVEDVFQVRRDRHRP